MYVCVHVCVNQMWMSVQVPVIQFVLTHVRTRLVDMNAVAMDLGICSLMGRHVLVCFRNLVKFT